MAHEKAHKEREKADGEIKVVEKATTNGGENREGGKGRGPYRQMTDKQTITTTTAVTHTHNYVCVSAKCRVDKQKKKKKNRKASKQRCLRRAAPLPASTVRCQLIAGVVAFDSLNILQP